MNNHTLVARLLLICLVVPCLCPAQFMDQFDQGATEGWDYYTGDGVAKVEFVPGDGVARMRVDATQDKQNVWWAIIKRDVSDSLDLDKLKDPSHELRVEARIRLSVAPRRVNFMINTQRTTDFHEQLREFDIPDTDWHTISMTTTDLDAVSGDSLFVQLGATDWGHDSYHVDLDYYRADIVDVSTAGPDKGEPLVYHPPLPELGAFSHHLEVAHDAVIHADFPDVNFHDWRIGAQPAEARVLTVNANQSAVLRWDFEGYKNAKADGAGLLELTTHSVAKGGNYIGAYGEDLGIEFGKVRIFEIMGGDPDWDQRTVTYQTFAQGSGRTETINGQTTFDTELTVTAGGKTFITLSRPVMQRLLDGQTRGLIIRPLGAIAASIYDSDDASEGNAPTLHFNTKR